MHFLRIETPVEHMTSSNRQPHALSERIEAPFEITCGDYQLRLLPEAHIKTGTRKTFLFFVEEPDSIRMKPYSCTREALSTPCFHRGFA